MDLRKNESAKELRQNSNVGRNRCAIAWGHATLSALLEMLSDVWYFLLCVSDWSILAGVGFLVEEAIRTDTRGETP